MKEKNSLWTRQFKSCKITNIARINYRRWHRLVTTLILLADNPAKELIPRHHLEQTTLSMGSKPSLANNSVETAVLHMRKRNVLLTGNSATNVTRKITFRSVVARRHLNNDDSSASATNVYTGQCENSFDQEYFIDTVSALSSVSLSPDRAFAQLLISPNLIPVQFKADTGGAVNILPHSQFKSLNVHHP